MISGRSDQIICEDGDTAEPNEREVDDDRIHERQAMENRRNRVDNDDPLYREEAAIREKLERSQRQE